MSKKPEEDIILDLTKEYPIIKSIGIPKLQFGNKGTKYPFYALEVEDGFRVPSSKAKTIGMAARMWGKNNKRKFAIRRDPENDGYHLVVRIE